MITPLRPTNYAGPAPHRLSRRRQRSVPPTAFSGTIFRLRPRLEVMEDRTLLSIFLVSNTGDGGRGSLRQAILDSNKAVGATNTIDFDISGSGVQTIVPLSSLPAISNPVLIDGFSQTGYKGTPLIEIKGGQAAGGDGLTITGSGVTVRGLEIDSFRQGAGIHLTGTGATADWIYGNFLGTNATGTRAEPNNAGVEIDGGAAHNLIGTNGDGIDDAAERNLISGNLFAGVLINGQGTDGNAVAGNFIGATVTGDVALDNDTSPQAYYSAGFVGGGVVIVGGASGNRVGTDGSSVDDAGQRNIIAGSGSYGISIIGAGTEGNIVAGNFIGTDVTGTISLGIAFGGVFIFDGASANWVGVNPVGGAAVGDEGNVISGASYLGVSIYEADDNVVAGDRIGTDATGAVALGNGEGGVEIDSSSGDTIGGTGAGAADVISGNGGSGVVLVGSDTLVEGDFIGTDATGTKALGNAQDGVEIDSSSGNTIGGTGASAADVISGNGASGVELDGASDNLVEGDFIGTDATGTTALGNAQEGVKIDADYFGPSTDNTIGGTSATAGNLITDNGGPGVAVGTSASDLSIGNQITANRIFGNTGQAIDLGADGVTYNSTASRQGPNNRQNFPIIVTTADGQLEGWLGGSMPDTPFHLDFFASAGHNSDGSGEAQDYLGSLEVTTDKRGQAVFDVPYTPPAGLPIVTATATDPQGNTSEVSALRRGAVSQPASTPRLGPGQLLVFSAAAGDAIALEDPDAGPLDLTWSLTLAASTGTLTLANTAGLTGSGNGTGSLSYRGLIAALNSALDGMTYTPPAGFKGNATLSIDAESDGAMPVQVPILVSHGVFVVTTTADSGTGSLRQAILDSNKVLGATDAIDFAIPGSGVQTIVPLSSLPAISNPVLIDGFTQPGYSGTPLIEINGSQAGGGDGLTIIGAGVTVRGLDINSFGPDYASYPFNGNPVGIHLTGTGATGDWIYGNFVGTDPTGTQAEPNETGVEIDGGASGNLIGTNGDGVNDTAEQNLISGNASDGVFITGTGTEGNVVAGDKIGTDATGAVALGNGGNGVDIGASSGNTIGGTAAGEADVISGNGVSGVALFSSSDNMVEGDFIGTDATGTKALGNAGDGVEIDGPSTDNTIGGTSATARNLITDNGGPGVVVTGSSSVGNQITANRIFGNTGQAIDLRDDGVTDNGTTPRSGPNNLQNFPILLTTADGQTEGWLGGSEPDTTYRIDVFASAGYGSGGAGEAEDYLGSMEETTDATGQVTFAVPFTAPAGLPVIAATATDPQGNTSEVSALRRATLHAPSLAVRAVPNQTLAFATKSGDGIAIQDLGAGPLIPVWSLTLSVSDGTLRLSSTTGLAGSGDGTGSLSYSGPLSALDAALNGMTCTPPAGPHVFAALTLDGQSSGALRLLTQFAITDGVLVVNTTADSGLGSLRQAILDSNLATGGTNTINFAIPGTGVHTIAPASPLPAITNPVVIDGTTQPGYAGAPLIAILGQGNGTAVPLTVGSDVTVKGVALGGASFSSVSSSAMFTVESVPLSQAQGGTITYQIVVAAGEDLVATAQALGTTTSLSLLDAQGQVVMRSDGLSAAEPIDAIDTYIGPGTYSLQVHDIGGKGSFALTTMITPSAAPFSPIPVGTRPDAIVAGDFNGDGKLDLAVANQGSSNVSILIGNGDGTFQPAVDCTVGGAPYAMVAGDFNGNGKLDLAVANDGSDDISVLLGNGDGTFQPQVTYSVGAFPMAIAAGDFSGDGKLDLAVVDQGNQSSGGTDPGGVSLLLGNGDGTFQPQVMYAEGSETIQPSIVVGDFNGDGRTDLAVAATNFNPVTQTSVSEVSVRLGNRDGTFQPAEEYALAGQGIDGIVAGDFNGHGRLDLVVAGPNWSTSAGEVSVLLSNGDGTFQPARTVATGVSGDLVAGDFNGDGRLDLALLGGGVASVLLGNGNGTFQPPVVTDEGLNNDAIVAGDFNVDGKLDLAGVNYFSNNVSILLGIGNGTFQSQATDAVGQSPTSIVAGDFNGDGRLDLAVAGGPSYAQVSGTVSILLGNGDGTFQPPVTYGVGVNPDAIAAGDFNGDGRLDLAVANSGSDNVSILLGNGDGTFQPAVDYYAGLFPTSIAAGDFNGEGRTDLVVAGSNSGEVAVLLGNGDGTFAPPVTYPVESYPDIIVGIVAGDFKGDGRLDLAVAYSAPSYYGGTGASGVNVLLGNGDGTFQPAVNYTAGWWAKSIVAGDFNGDGRLDLAVVDEGNQHNENSYTAWNSPGGVSVLLGNGDGTFQPAVLYAAGTDPVSIVAGDFNGHGKLDLAVANSGAYGSAGTVSVLLGNGDGTFQPAVPYEAGTDPPFIFAGDFNGDGRTDLAVPNSLSADISVLLGNGDGTFSGPGQLATSPHATPLVADVNGDGTEDVLVVDGSGDILYRHGIPGQSGTFEPPVTINPNNPSRDIAWLPNSDQGRVLASVDAQDNDITFYGYRDGGFVRLSGSLATGQLPAQIVVADLNGDGLTDLVVRNAGGGTLSVFFPKTFIGPVNPLDAQIGLPAFLPPVTLSVGLGVSDVQAVDTTGSGRLDLVVTNKLTGQVSVLLNLGDGTFAAPAPYRAGTGLSAVDPGSTPEVTSLEATAGLAAGPLTTGGAIDLVTINPGSYTMDVLAGLGAGRFANPVAVQTQSPAQVIRVADFNHDGIPDVAVLTASGLSVYLGNGNGGFASPVTYAVPAESSGLTVADVNHDGNPDLLVGDAYGDLLVLLGQGDGTFQPYHHANQSIELAVADLTGNGSTDIIYADQGLDRVVVDYGGGNSSVLADQSTGLLDPGAVKLADLNGDGIPDLIVANSGSNNVLIYPGLGNGQFGPAINDGNGYFVGTNPVGITVANLTGALPDLVVADKGSNQVSILINQSQQGGAISFSAGARLNSGGSGPVSTVVGYFSGGAFPDILVTNSQSNDVALLPGVGQGFFNDTNPTTFPVGANPVTSFVGNFNGQTDLLTVNAGSNDLTLISGFEGSNPTTSTIASGGVDPDAAFAFASSSGFEDLVVGNAGDGVLALFEGGSGGLSLMSAATEPNLPDPTALAFSALTGGQVQFYAATAGRESAELVALSLSIETAPTSSTTFPSASSVAQLVPLNESSLPLVATVLTLTIGVPGAELNLGLAETEAAAAAAFLPGTGVSVGQGLSSGGRGGPVGDDGAESDESGAGVAGAVSAIIAPWERFVIGLDEALEKFQRENPNGVSGAPARDAASDRPAPPPAAGVPTQGRPTSLKSGTNPIPNGGESDQTESASSLGVDAIDTAVHSMWGEDALPDRPVDGARTERRPPGLRRIAPVVPEPRKDGPGLALTPLVVATLATEWVHAWRWDRTVRPRWPGRVWNPVRRRRVVI